MGKFKEKKNPLLSPQEIGQQNYYLSMYFKKTSSTKLKIEQWILCPCRQPQSPQSNEWHWFITQMELLGHIVYGEGKIPCFNIFWKYYPYLQHRKVYLKRGNSKIPARQQQKVLTVANTGGEATEDKENRIKRRGTQGVETLESGIQNGICPLLANKTKQKPEIPQKCPPLQRWQSMGYSVDAKGWRKVPGVEKHFHKEPGVLERWMSPLTEGQ